MHYFSAQMKAADTMNLRPTTHIPASRSEKRKVARTSCLEGANSDTWRPEPDCDDGSVARCSHSYKETLSVWFVIELRAPDILYAMPLC